LRNGVTTHPVEAIVRSVQPDDEILVQQLFENSGKRFTRVPIKDLRAIVQSRLALVAVQGDNLRGVIVSIWPEAPFAWLDAMAVAPGEDDRILDVLLDSLEDRVRESGARQVLCSVEQGDSGWVQRKLLARGFQLSTRFLRYEKNDFKVPPIDAPEIMLRSAEMRDLPEIFRVEAACFEPPWRCEESGLRHMLERCAIFRVAVIDGMVAGFQYSDIDDAEVGQFLHVAVAPRFRGLKVANVLLADAVEFFEGHGARWIETRTEQRNVRAQRLFASFGFQLAISYRDVFAKVLESNHRAESLAA
jgi:ribosomal-protein-alanine N-acetyltransferase